MADVGSTGPVIRILDKWEALSTLPGRQGKVDVVVNYQVDGTRNYQTRMPKENYSPDAMMKQIDDEEVDRQGILSKTWTAGGLPKPE